jgi:Protein of unknown function (DUF3073)
MGRGRAKAKQVKVARQLKYSGGGVDLDRLRAEFGVGTDRQDTDDHDPYADFANRYSADDEDDGEGYSDYGGDDFDDEEDLDQDIDDEDLNEAEGLEVADLGHEHAGDPVREYPHAKGSADARVNRANGS